MDEVFQVSGVMYWLRWDNDLGMVIERHEREKISLAQAVYNTTCRLFHLVEPIPTHRQTPV
jgi:hypothetical protein